MIDLNKVNVIDNFVPLHFQNYLYKKYTNNYSWNLSHLEGNTAWGVNKSLIEELVYEDHNLKNHIQDGFQFANTHLNQYEGIFNYNDYESLYLLHYLQLHTNYKYHFIPLRIKINLQVPLPKSQPQKINTPHIDFHYPNPNYYTLIYYVNDSDGDTTIFNEKYVGTPIKNFNISQKVSPQKGKVVIFPTNQFHCGSHPINSKARIVINYNFELIPL